MKNGKKGDGGDKERRPDYRLKSQHHGTEAWTTWVPGAATAPGAEIVAGKGEQARFRRKALEGKRAVGRRHAGGLKGAKSASYAIDAAAVRIEYPREDETIRFPAYTLQIGTVPEAVHVDISIDQGEWASCRESLGLWWYDWSGYDPGEHEAAARIHKEGGKILVSEARIFFVKF